jgi:hypothetical protein
MDFCTACRVIGTLSYFFVLLNVNNETFGATPHLMENRSGCIQIFPWKQWITLSNPHLWSRFD